MTIKPLISVNLMYGHLGFMWNSKSGKRGEFGRQVKGNIFNEFDLLTFDPGIWVLTVGLDGPG